MMDFIMDALIDSIKLLPYLFVTFVVLELMEHKCHIKVKKYLKIIKNMDQY